jgi:cephalosporin hydroxylase
MQSTERYEAAGAEYLRHYYELGVWKRQHYRGVRILKAPTDLWNYQEIFFEHDIDWVIETGTRHGGSALFFADLLQLRGAQGNVITVDVTHDDLQVQKHPRIDLVLADSGSEEVAMRLEDMLPDERGPLFMILDSDHRKEHVLRELENLTPMLRKGDYLVVEDTCVNGHPVRTSFGPGPMEALEVFLASVPGQFATDEARARKFGFSCAPNGYLVRS